jgi:hypothetical protein
MLAYLATKEQFLSDAPHIEDLVREEVRRKLHINVSSSEYASWRNSLGNAMFHAMNTPEIPDDAGVAVEYRVNGRKYRIDFMISGETLARKESLVIVELKQWTDIQYSELAEHVRTSIGGAVRDARHPSYQAWSYASHLKSFNEYVYMNAINVSACAYLHNCIDSSVVGNSRYENELRKAPVFLHGEIDELRNLITGNIAIGSGTSLLERIDSAAVRPSKQLADAVGAMLVGSEEFVLLDEQKTVLEKIVLATRKSFGGQKQVLIVVGGPGTGKSVISINALARLTGEQMNARYVTPNAAPRAVIQSKLKNLMPNNVIDELFSGSGSYVASKENEFDLLLVDEAHRLKLRTQYAKGGSNQIREVMKSSKTTVFFIDEAQKVTWRDIGEISAIEEIASEMNAHVERLELTSQFRCAGSDDYMAWLDDTLGVRVDEEHYFSLEKFDFRILDTPNELHALIKEKNRENNKSRLVAGYCWEWISDRQPKAFDISMPEFGFKARWNLKTHGSAWIINPKSVEEIGCIHTCQGLEVDYIGVIVGPDLKVREDRLETNPIARAKSDRSLFGFKKELKNDPVGANIKADELIRNTYRTLMSRGMRGCYVYFTDPETAQYFRDRLPS